MQRAIISNMNYQYDKNQATFDNVGEYQNREMVTVEDNKSISDIADMMVRLDISSVAVVKNNKIAGIVTERDIVKVISEGRAVSNITAGEVMSKPLVSIASNTSMEEAARIMLQNKIKHLFIQDQTRGEMAGIISTTDLARYLRKKYSAVDETLINEVWELYF